jgi:hypothetical protein
MVVSLWCLGLWQSSSGAWGHHLPSSTIWRGGGGDNSAHASYMQMNYTIVMEIFLILGEIQDPPTMLSSDCVCSDFQS